MSKDTRKCNLCNTVYEKGFFGTGYKYCSPACRKESSIESMKAWYKRTHPRDTKKKCVVCHRIIHSVGIRKKISKYCSSMCMFKSRQIKRGDRFVTIKIPVKYIPKLFKLSIQPKLD